ncbi:hypothetical protein [Sulfuricurvum sp.]|uniref:hypothetical protein n=1 Tax=Sulfuricurvum sp. TaxID=2025608 RepID=UPI003C65AEB2
MTSVQSVLHKRFEKAQKHYEALRDYCHLIEKLSSVKNIFEVDIFAAMIPEEKAILDAYLKRFASLQDFLGAKIFPLLIEISGMGTVKMSEVLFMMEKEGIIDSFDNWMELREIRNELEHDYPDELQEALNDLKFCVDHFGRLESYYLNAKAFAERFIS